MGYHLNQLDNVMKIRLIDLGKKKFGTSTISKTIISILHEYLENELKINQTIEQKKEVSTIDEQEKEVSTIDNERVRIYATLFKKQFIQLEKLCEYRKVSTNYFLKSCVLKAIGRKYILDGNELEQMRISNYNLTKIGSNINQIAKRINTMNSYESSDIKELNNLVSGIKDHIEEVRKVLEMTQNKW